MHAVNKQLLYNLIHIQHQPDTLCDNDTKSCYDCIVNQVESMAIQQLFMPAQPMKYMLGIFQDLEHHIRTANGTSRSFIHNHPLIPFQCIFQGNITGPTIWVSVSVPLI